MIASRSKEREVKSSTLHAGTWEFADADDGESAGEAGALALAAGFGAGAAGGRAGCCARAPRQHAIEQSARPCRREWPGAGVTLLSALNLNCRKRLPPRVIRCAGQ